MRASIGLENPAQKISAYVASVGCGGRARPGVTVGPRLQQASARNRSDGSLQQIDFLTPFRYFQSMKTDHEELAPRELSSHLVEPLPSGMAPQRAIMKGRFVCLEPVDPSVHAEELYDASHRNAEALKIWEFIPHGPWPDPVSFEQWLRDTVDRLENVVFAIRNRDTGKATGMVQYHHIESKTGVVEIGGIWFAPEFQRTRGATEVLFLVLSHVMGDLRYRRVQWRCDSQNKRSRAAVKRLGFGFEGIFYNESIVKGKNKDTAWYSLLDYEWPAVKEKIMTWLADDNFDDAGLAKTSLSELMPNRTAPV